MEKFIVPMVGDPIVETFNNDIFTWPAHRNGDLKGCVAAALEAVGPDR
jgi:hypothetical protein